MEVVHLFYEAIQSMKKPTGVRP